MSGTPQPARLTKADLEARFRALEGDVQQRANEAKDAVKMVAIAGGVALLLLAFALGQRRGKRKTTIVEVRRF